MSLEEQFKELYNRLRNGHPSDILPLESQLPTILRYNQRDNYRTIVTMILSQGTDDWSLSRSLGKFFQKYRNIDDFHEVKDQSELEAILTKHGFKANDGRGKTYNPERLWHLIKNQRTNHNGLSAFVKSLPPSGYGNGYGEKMVRALKAYVIGERNLLPLDTPGFEVFEQELSCSSVNQARSDIESCLSEDPDVILIDFHELLRFEGQTVLKKKKLGDRKYDEIIKGWNAWRMLCARDNSKFDEKWIRNNLVKDDRLAKEIWAFYQRIKNHK